MDDSLGNIKIIKDHFKASAPSIDSLQDIASSSVSQPRTDNYLSIGLIAVCGVGEN